MEVVCGIRSFWILILGDEERGDVVLGAGVVGFGDEVCGCGIPLNGVGDLGGGGDVPKAVAGEEEGGRGKERVFGDFGGVGDGAEMARGGDVGVVSEGAGQADEANMVAYAARDVVVEDAAAPFLDAMEVAGMVGFGVFGELDRGFGRAEKGAAVSEVGGPDLVVDDEGDDGGGACGSGIVMVEFDEGVFEGVPDAGVGAAEFFKVVGEVGGEILFEKLGGFGASVAVEYTEEGDLGVREKLGDVGVFHLFSSALRTSCVRCEGADRKGFGLDGSVGLRRGECETGGEQGGGFFLLVESVLEFFLEFLIDRVGIGDELCVVGFPVFQRSERIGCCE